MQRFCCDCKHRQTPDGGPWLCTCPVFNTWDPVAGGMLPAVECATMRAASGKCGAAGYEWDPHGEPPRDFKNLADAGPLSPEVAGRAGSKAPVVPDPGIQFSAPEKTWALECRWGGETWLRVTPLGVVDIFSEEICRKAAAVPCTRTDPLCEGQIMACLCLHAFRMGEDAVAQALMAGYTLDQYLSAIPRSDAEFVNRCCKAVYSWRPISELDREKNQFVLVCEGQAVRLMYWNHMRARWEVPHRELSIMIDVMAKDVCANPTHFMPCPDAACVNMAGGTPGVRE